MQSKAMPQEAHLTGKATETQLRENGEFLYFSLRDKDHSFIMGLRSILECLRFAEKEGYVPEIAKQWWWMMDDLYHGILDRDE